MLQAFISYVDADSDCAAAIATGLTAAGCATWRDETDVARGRAYLDSIFGAIDASSVVIAVISRASVLSAQVDAEISHAFGSGKPILPVLWGLAYADFEALKPTWDLMLQDTTTLYVPLTGLDTVGSRLVLSLEELGLLSTAAPAGGETGATGGPSGQRPPSPRAQERREAPIAAASRVASAPALAPGTARRSRSGSPWRRAFLAVLAAAILIGALLAATYGRRLLLEQRTLDRAVSASNDRIRSARNFAAEARKSVARRDYVRAEASYRTAIALDPHNTRYVVALADVLFTAKDYDAAGQTYQALASKKSGSAFLQHRLGVCLAAQKKMAEAEKAFQAAVTSDDKNMAYRHSLATSLWAQRKFAQADKQYRTIAESDRFNAKLRCELGDIYYRRKQYSKALPYYTAAAHMEGWNRSFRYSLGACRDALKRQSKQGGPSAAERKR